MARITSPFGAFTEALEVIRGHDLGGRRAIVTGAASGIGIETARALAAAGAETVLAVRNPSAGAEAAAAINASLGDARVRVENLDLANLHSVHAFADRWGSLPLNLLVNNAGVMATPQGVTADGFETQIGANHFGHYALTRRLLPALEKGAPARVVQLSSIGHRRSVIHFEDIHYRTRPYDKWEAYGQSKTANALFAVAFNRRHAGRGITANAVMPGGIMTGLQKHMPQEEKIAFGWIDADGNIAQGFKTASQGASTSVWAAVGPELEGIGGLYLEDCAEAEPWSSERPFRGVLPHALDPEAAERLWVISAESVGLPA